VTREETVGLIFDAFNRRDIEAVLGHLDENAEMVPLRAGVEDVSYRGHGGAREWFADIEDNWEGMSIALDEVLTVGDRLVVFGKLRAEGKISGAKTESGVAWIVGFRGDRVSLLRSYGDPRAALADAAEAG
jgi:ketosteroid isomerase-like protein